MYPFGRIDPVSRSPRHLVVVIVHFHGGDDFRRCLDACLTLSSVDEVIVVDNGGLDPRFEPPSRVRVISMGRNAGYGRAANVGLAASDAECVLLLNQDVVVTAEAVDALVAGGRAAHAWLAGPRLVDGAGHPAPPKLTFPPPVAWSPPAAAPVVGGARPVPWIAGAAMLFCPGHTDLRFDERLFMYGEDEELGLRVGRAGGTVVWVEAATVVHVGGTASGRRWSTGAITRRTVANRARFVRWHRGWSGAARYLASLIRPSRARL